MKKILLLIAFCAITTIVKSQAQKDTLIYFDATDKPENMGQSQKTNCAWCFCNEHKDKLKSFVFSSDKKIMYFVKPDTTQGRAVIVPVPNDFDN